jgi:uncharacterized membrane protein
MEPLKRRSIDNPSAPIVQVASSFSGPIPPPNVLKQYDEVVPGAADRILRMAEQQSAHRQRLEEQAIANMDRNARWGMAFGFIVILSCIAVAAYCIYKGENLTGFAMVIGSIAGLSGTYIYGKKKTDQDLSAKRAANRIGQA